MIRITRSTAAALVVLVGAMASSGCVDEPSPVGPESAQWALVSVPDDSLREDQPMLAIARKLPTFAGFWFIESDQVVIALTDIRDFDQAKRMVAPWLRLHQPSGGFVPVKARHSFLHLARVRAIVAQHGFGRDRVVTLSVKESENRVRVGVLDTRSMVAQELRGRMTTAGVSEDAVQIVAVPAPRNAASLDSDYPGVIQGGWQIQNRFSETCTLGFPARRVADGVDVFVTNSHCTEQQHAPDGGTIAAPWYNWNSIGYEIADPYPTTCWSNLPIPSYYECRNSDAALIRATAPIQLGRIARTVDSSGCEDCSMSKVVSQTMPTIPIVAAGAHNFEGETLHKIGKKTGWTYGVVESTCEDTWLDDGWIRMCSDFVGYSSGDGDSGSPVFRIIPYSGAAELRGVHFGWWPWPWNDGLTSDLNQIQLDLGMLQVTGLSISIWGPSVVPSARQCQYQAIVQGGRPPHTYRWQKDFYQVGTAQSIMLNTGSESFSLTLTVTDADNVQTSDVMYVNVDPLVPLPPGCQ